MKSQPTVAPVVAIVDDDASMRESLSSLVTSAGYGAQLFESATAFLAQHTAHELACIVLDAQMPGLSGLDLQLRLVELKLATPIIFVTAHAANVRAQALAQGAVAVLGKPFSAESLLAAIQSALRGPPEPPPPSD